MKPTGGPWRCVLCGRETTALHEIIFGRGNRQVCIEYNIQCPLCYICNSNAVAHGPDAKSYRNYFLKDVLKVDPIKTVIAVHSKEARGYLDEIKDHCKQRIGKYEL